MCHDSKAPGRDHFAWERTFAEQRTHNPHVKDGAREAGFVAFPTARDAKLAALTLLLPSIQVNIRAGRFPEAEANGVRYLEVPVTVTCCLESGGPVLEQWGPGAKAKRLFWMKPLAV